MASQSDSVELYNALVATNTNLERKGKTTPYTSFNGHMTSFLSKEGDVGMRLSATDIDAFIAEHNSELMEQHGRTMKDFVRIPAAMLPQTELLAAWLQRSYDHAASLKPKPTKRKAQ